NLSIPPLIPFIISGALMLGHWMFTRQMLEFSPRQITAARLAAYFWQWIAGSVALAVMVAMMGTIITYAIARLARRK
ncbi:MAG TPA: DUF2062 domain-containing protein, partial [Verrucomicrobiae bacterium]|nr:DUF2062 domain-containing protein [Verrucomicrobiae bacterium]